VHVEDIPPAPTAGAVWIAGVWAWDGHAYVWVAGRWELPPSTKSRWQPAITVERDGVTVHIPGGWIQIK
jgi:hypothetical protein